MKRFAPTLLFFLLFLFAAMPVFARIGVGIGTGKIQVDEKLNPGTIYELPPVTILNTGDEPSNYTVSITYHEAQPELMPDAGWFTFDPQIFYLEPGASQFVTIKLNVPIKTTPGDYFAYVEGSPTATAQQGTTTIGVAAATKLYFTIAPANIFQGIYYRIASFWANNQPYTNIVGGVVALMVILGFARKHLNIQVSVGKSKEEKAPKPEAVTSILHKDE